MCARLTTPPPIQPRTCREQVQLYLEDLNCVYWNNAGSRIRLRELCVRRGYKVLRRPTQQDLQQLMQHLDGLRVAAE